LTLLEANILQPIINIVESIIVFFEGTVGMSWGLSIVALTIVIRLLVLPLSLKGIKSMRRMQILAPELKEIQEKYKAQPTDSPARRRELNQAKQRKTMELYQREKINPFASCLPFLLQIPFFFAVYQLLRGKDFEQDVINSGADQGFLFIQSVIEKPTGLEQILLIVLFVSTTILTFLYTMATSQTASGPQKYIFMVLPLVMIPLIGNFPAGLSLYWITTNIFSLGQQVVVQKLMPAPDMSGSTAVVEEKKTTPPPPPPRKRKRRR